MRDTDFNLDSLIDLLQNADAVPAEKIPAMLAQLAAIQGSLAARLLANGNVNNQPAAPAKLLTVEEAADRIGVSKDFLYRNQKTLPFVVHVGRALRFSESGIEKWIRNRSGK
jgi:excisionase family DNA binding protein